MIVKGTTINPKEIMALIQNEIMKGTKFKMMFPKDIDKIILEEICLGIYHAATTELD